METNIRTVVSSIKSVAKGVFVLSFKRSFDFKAGQVVSIDIEEINQARLYSIASGEESEFIDILFDERPGGKLTPFLSKVKAGDTIWISKAFGEFVCEEDDEEAWFIASGTGIAPYVSMICSGKGSKKRLIHGGRTDENFYYSDILEQYLDNENYIRCASQQKDTKHFKGRLTTWLREHPHLPTNIKYYLCGSAEMVVEVRDLLIAKGVPFQKIVSETYF